MDKEEEKNVYSEKEYIIDRNPGGIDDWDPEIYKTEKLSPAHRKFLYWCLYRLLDLEGIFMTLTDIVRAKRLRVVYKLKGYDMSKMEKEFDKFEAVKKATK